MFFQLKLHMAECASRLDPLTLVDDSSLFSMMPTSTDFDGEILLSDFSDASPLNSFLEDAAFVDSPTSQSTFDIKSEPSECDFSDTNTTITTTTTTTVASTTSDIFNTASPVDLASLLAGFPATLDNLVAQQEDAPGKIRKRAKKGTVPRSQQNRASAQRVRDKQRAREQYLEDAVEAFDTENADLDGKLKSLKSDQDRLLAELSALRESVARTAATLLQEAAHITDSSTDVSTPATPATLTETDSDSDFTHGTPNMEAATPEGSAAEASPSALSDTDTIASPRSEYMAAAVDNMDETPAYPDALTITSSPGLDSSCESAVLADLPRQQDILRLVIMLQMMMGTTLSWATTVGLMLTLSTVTKGVSPTLTLSSSSAPSIPTSPKSCREAALGMISRRRSISVPPDLPGPYVDPRQLCMA